MTCYAKESKMGTPEIDLCFSGSLRGVPITEATNQDGDKVNTNNMTSTELVDKLNKGELFISFENAIKNAVDSDIELFDYDESV